MHTFRAFLRASALLLFFAASPARPAETPAELIVHLSRTRLATSDSRGRADLLARLATPDVAAVRRLDDGLPALARMQRSRPDPFAFDPSRVLLVTVRDTARLASVRRDLKSDPQVIWVEPNAVREPALVPSPWPPGLPNDPYFADGRQWGLMNLGAAGNWGGVTGADIRAVDAWTLSAGSGDIRLALADTGVDPQHPELQAPIAGGGWRMELGLNVTSEPSPSWADTFGHGTPVAGVMAARTNDGPHLGAAGVAGVCGGDGAANPGCRIVPIKIAPGHSNTATSFDIARAILYATSVGARAVNLSFAGGGPSRLERLAMQYAITHGCVVVAAAGNQGYANGTAPQYPAAYAADGLGIQVGASDRWDRRATWSSYGPGLDLLAPGDEIWSCWMTYPTPLGIIYPGYIQLSGTSFAAPFATGTVGLLAGYRPELMDTDFQRVLRESAHDLGPTGPDRETGWGRLDAAAALRAVDPALGIWHDEVAATSFRSLGLDTLWVGEPGPAAMEQVTGVLRAERIEVTATVTLPDSFVSTVRIWPRVGGTTTLRGDRVLPYATPWAEVVAQTGRAFTLRGYILCAADSEWSGERWMPLPPDQARFGFTVLGPVQRTRLGAGPPEPREPARLSAAPNPFRSATLLRGPAGAGVVVLDLAGRVVRRGDLDRTTGTLTWDGRDARGRQVPSGLYVVRCETRSGPLVARVVRTE